MSTDQLNALTREDIIQAIDRIDKHPELIRTRNSYIYNLLYNQEIYPPILVLSEASELIGGDKITLRSLGESTEKAFAHLRKLGFNIIATDENGFTWVPFFRELVKYVIERKDGQDELISLLHELNFEGNLEDVDVMGKVPLEEIDPFTFIAFFVKSKNQENRKIFCRRVKQKLSLKSPSPDDFNGMPSAQAQALWFFPYKKDRSFEISALWKLAQQVVEGELKDEDFQKALSINSVAETKLTQGIFWLNPEAFFPIDGQTRSYLTDNGIDPNFNTSDEYLEILKKVKTKFKLPFYEISRNAWALNQEEKPIDKDEKWYELASAVQRLNNVSAANKFFDLTKSVIKSHKLKSSDVRTYAAALDNPLRLHLTIGGRYITMIQGKSENCILGFKAEESQLNALKSKYPEAKKINPILIRDEAIGLWVEVDAKNVKTKAVEETVIQASKYELASKKSQYRERNGDLHNPWIFTAALDKKIRKQLFTEDKVDFKLQDDKTKMVNAPLNQILYGPPGTGKTFNTVNHALEICGEDIAGLPREEVKELFEKKVNEGQIVFTTFHQSMTYEDFVEGIKPVEPEKEGDPVIYRVEDGIFRKLCVEASFTLAKENGSIETENVLDFSLAYDSFVQELEEKLSSEDFVELETKSGGKILVDGISHKGNLLLKHKGGTRNYTVSKIRLTKLQKEIKNLEEINNINNQFRAIIGGSNSSAYWAVLNAIRLENKSVVTKEAERKYTWEDKKEVVSSLNKLDLKEKIGKPYVLIIDEINRGNVSQIFGELITLIEEDKRLGKEEALDVQLPYSKEQFGVPPNLFIIGTMNTADRSVEALDTALRRRFSFIEMPPLPNLISPKNMIIRLWNRSEHINATWDDKAYRNDADSLYSLLGIDKGFEENYHGVEGEDEYWMLDHLKDISANNFIGLNLEVILTTINKRIEKLIDKDHMIGHSYFLTVQHLEDLKQVFQHKIIPLLQEYFFGDIGKIGLVIGKGFFEESDQDVDEDFFAPFEDYDSGSLIEKKIYHLHNISEMGDKEFVVAIDSLLRK